MSSKHQISPVRRPTKASTPVTQTATRPASSTTQRHNPILIFAQILGLVASVSLVTLASQLALHPLYGCTASSRHAIYVVIVGWILPTDRWRKLPAHRMLLFMSLLLATAPLSAKLVASWTGRWGSATWGPVTTLVAVMMPILMLSSVLMRHLLPKLHPVIGPRTTDTTIEMMFFVIVVFEHFWRKRLPSGGVFTSCNIFLSLSVLAALLSALTVRVTGTTPQEASRSLITTVITISIPLFLVLFSKANSPCSPPKLPATYSSIYHPPVNASLFSQLGYRLGLNELEIPKPLNATVKLLARTDSITGTIVVAEYTEESLHMPLRFLRADHSLLGGKWVGPKSYGSGGGNSIYSTFVQQEAIRLVKRNHKEGENALIIGLGVGIAADALIAHGHKVHVVEIDPAVYTYARQFFNLSEPFSVDFQDARTWVHDRYSNLNIVAPVLDVIQRESTKFPIIIHDCFSGGGVPSHIFTMEFWDELKGIMTDDGVLAVNFVGHVGSESARAIWFTLQEAFSVKNGGRGCRVFHDVMADEHGAHQVNPTEVLNMVYFCQNDGHITTTGNQEHKGVPKKVEFRPAVQADILDSYMRYRVLSTLDQRELSEQEITGLSETDDVKPEEWILTDKNNKLGKWQSAVAIEHWGLMREVLPPPVWEVY